MNLCANCGRKLASGELPVTRDMDMGARTFEGFRAGLVWRCMWRAVLRCSRPRILFLVDASAGARS
jgi:hypothetical protein